MKNSIDYWVELADYDLETADAMLLTRRYLYVGFMCHQTIEKLLKALYTKFITDIPPFTHNLMYLIELLKNNVDFPETHIDLVTELMPLNIESRYPSYKDKLYNYLTEEVCLSILNKTKLTEQWIKTKL